MADGRIFVAGASGYIGQFVVRELARRGYEVVAFVRTGSQFERPRGTRDGDDVARNVEIRHGDVTDIQSVNEDGLQREHFDGLISCIASRTGGIKDAWKIDYDANCNLLNAASEHDVPHFVLLSAICVQRPQLAFQLAKLRFEEQLRASNKKWSIVRPTAFFKSVAGQIKRVLDGKPFMMFGRGDGPACKPISETDLAAYIADCLSKESLQNQILPVGGPDDALTVRERAEMLFELAQRPPRYRHIPLGMLDAAINIFDLSSKLADRFADKAEFARIARYYATESMLVFDQNTERYDAEATPSFGEIHLRDFYRDVMDRGIGHHELGEHAIF